MIGALMTYLPESESSCPSDFKSSHNSLPDPLGSNWSLCDTSTFSWKMYKIADPYFWLYWPISPNECRSFLWFKVILLLFFLQLL